MIDHDLLLLIAVGVWLGVVRTLIFDAILGVRGRFDLAARYSRKRQTGAELPESENERKDENDK